MDELGAIEILFEDDFVDLDLPMANFQRNLDGDQEITARGRHGNANVGFSVSLGPLWERQDLENSDVALYWGRAELVSLGGESDAFLRVLDEAYGTRLDPIRMHGRAPFLVVSLAGDPARLEHAPAKMKFFSRVTTKNAVPSSISTSTLKHGRFSFTRRIQTIGAESCWR